MVFLWMLVFVLAIYLSFAIGVLLATGVLYLFTPEPYHKRMSVAIEKSRRTLCR